MQRLVSQVTGKKIVTYSEARARENQHFSLVDMFTRCKLMPRWILSPVLNWMSIFSLARRCSCIINSRPPFYFLTLLKYKFFLVLLFPIAALISFFSSIQCLVVVVRIWISSFESDNFAVHPLYYIKVFLFWKSVWI